MNIEIWTIGKDNDTFVEEGIRHYLKRVSPYCNVQFVILPPPKRTGKMLPEQSKAMEEKTISSRFDPQKHYLILLDETGKMHTSKEWSENIAQIQNESVKTLVLLIGGPWGVTDGIKKMAKKTWSLSKLTFPHQLVRLIVAEQLYRSFSILHHSGYHHE